MKILHVIATLDPSTGGPPIIATRLVAAMARAGHDVGIFSYDSPGRNEAVGKMLAGVPGFDQVKVRNAPLGGRAEKIFASAAKSVLKEIVPQYQIVHIHGVWDPMLVAASKVAAANRIPFVVTPHGMLDPWSLSQRALKKNLALTLSTRPMLNRAAFVHWGNRDEVKLTEHLGITAKGVIVGNGIFIEELENRPPIGTFRAKWPALGDAPFALFLARLHFKKGLDILADALGIVKTLAPQLHVVVAGPDDGMQSEFEKRIKAHGVADRVHITGPIYGQEKLAALTDATMFVLPSRQEGFSVGITEALACGLPVVATEACHFPEVAEVNAGYCTALEAKPVAEGMAALVNDPHRAKEMGQNGRRLVLDRFTWPKVAEQLVTAYQSSLR